MALETRTVYPSKQNKRLISTFQPPEEGQSVQRPKLCDKHGNKDEDNSPENVNNVLKGWYAIKERSQPTTLIQVVVPVRFPSMD